MEISSLALSALKEAFEKNNLDIELLIESTGVTLEDFNNSKRRISWDSFVKLFNNCEKYLGKDGVINSVSITGLSNKNISHIVKCGTNLISAKPLYWATSKFVGKHLYKNCLNITYSTVSSNQVKMTISINENLQPCRLLLETYSRLFEILPNLTGQENAKVFTQITGNSAEYTIFLRQKTIFSRFYSYMMAMFQSLKNYVTLLERLEDQAEEIAIMAEEKSQLLRVVCHDVANQVLAIDYYLDRLSQSQNLEQDDRKILNVTKSNSNKLSNLLKNIQVLESTSIKGIVLSPVKIETVIKNVQENYFPQLLHKNIDLIIDNKIPGNILALAEQTSLESSVLGNLLSNAIKFSDPGSEIEITAALLNDKVIISLKDLGKGLDISNKDKLFNSKLRLSSKGTNGEIGSGFGLGIVATYVNLYGGRIDVINNKPKGTVFTIELDTFKGDYY